MKIRNILLLLLLLLLPLLLFVACTKDAAIPECSIKIVKRSVTEYYTSSEMVFSVIGVDLDSTKVSCLLVPVGGGDVNVVSPTKFGNSEYKLSCSNVDGFNYDVNFVLITSYDVYNCLETYNFKTKDFIAPIVKTYSVDDCAGEAEATFKGKIVDKGGRGISEYGFCFCHGEGTPTLDDFVVPASNISSEDRFSYDVTLEKGRTYTVRTYAKNDIGIGYGETVTFQKQ